MGRIKNEAAGRENFIINWLIGQDFKYDRGAQGEAGLVKTYSVWDGLYCVWVTINLFYRQIYIYKEYNCGGCVGKDIISIPQDVLDDLDLFIDFLDETLEAWIGY